MSKIFIIHGTGGNPKGNWFPWLKKELEKQSHTVFVPKFTTPEGQTIEKWMSEFKESTYYELLDEDSIIIGHSLGPAFILSVLEKLAIPKPIKATFLVAGFISPLGNEYFDKLNNSFINKKFNWAKIKKNCKKFYVINSDNDPYVPLSRGKELAEELNTELITLRGAGHINEESGYKKFEFLLEMINKVN